MIGETSSAQPVATRTAGPKETSAIPINKTKPVQPVIFKDTSTAPPEFQAALQKLNDAAQRANSASPTERQQGIADLAALMGDQKQIDLLKMYANPNVVKTLAEKGNLSFLGGKDVVPLTEFGKGKPLEGNVFNVPKVDFYGDLHGVDADLNEDTDRLIIIVGDLADRGPKSAGRVRENVKKVREGKAVYMWGNHEGLYAAGMTDDPTGQNRDKVAFLDWIYNGGRETAEGFGINFSSLDNRVTNGIKNQGGDTTDPVQRQKMTEIFLGADRNTIANGPPKQGEADYQNKLNKFNQAMQRVSELQNQCKQNTEMKDWYDVLVKHGKLWVSADGVFAVHGGVTSVDEFKKLEDLQRRLASGDASAIFELNDDSSPLWKREEYLRMINNPQEASKFRAELNSYLAVGTTDRPPCRAEMVVSGHTPAEVVKGQYGLENAGKTVSTARSADAKFVVLDYGAVAGGAVGVMRVEMGNQGSVKAGLIDAKNNQPLVATTGEVPHGEWQIKPAENSQQSREMSPQELATMILSGEGPNEADKVAKDGEAAKNQLAEEAGIDMPELSHQMLEILATKGSVPQALQEYGRRVQSEAGDDRAKQALGIDIELAGLQQEYKGLEHEMQKAKGKKLGQLEERRNELVVKFKMLSKAREANPAPNAINKLALAMGVNPDELQEGGPGAFTAMSDLIGAAIANGEVRDGLISRLQAGVDSGMFRQEDVDLMKKFLGSEAVAKFVKDKAWFGVKVGGGIGLFLLLMMWMSGKGEQKGPMG